MRAHPYQTSFYGRIQLHTSTGISIRSAICFYTGQHMLSIYCTIKRDMYLKYHNPHDISTVYPFLHSSRLYIRNRHIDHAARDGRGKAWLLGPTRFHNPNSISTVHPSLHGSSLYPTDTQRPRYINSNRPRSMPCIAT